jgi:REP element-mobilizing transposase RayT
MARPLRIQAPGLTYHVTARGNGGMTIYCDDCDRERFLELLACTVESTGVVCHAHCMMTNHYHLVVTTPDANLSKAIKHLNGTYGQWWNRRHGHVGHVFQGRFDARVVQEDVYLLTACRYVVRNPVRGRLVDDPADWLWSSYRPTAGLAPIPAFLRPELLWHMFGASDVAAATRCYREFIGARDADAVKLAAVPILGDPEFVDRFKTWRDRASCEVPLRERRVRPALETLFAGAITRAARGAQTVRAYDLGYSMAEIARHLEVHYCTVSRMISALTRGQTCKLRGCKT